jgi:hypothetical protein
MRVHLQACCAWCHDVLSPSCLRQSLGHVWQLHMSGRPATGCCIRGHSPAGCTVFVCYFVHIFISNCIIGYTVSKCVPHWCIMLEQLANSNRNCRSFAVLCGLPPGSIEAVEPRQLLPQLASCYCMQVESALPFLLPAIVHHMLSASLRVLRLKPSSHK